MEDVQGNLKKYISWIYNINNHLLKKKNLLLDLFYMPIASQSKELSYLCTQLTYTWGRIFSWVLSDHLGEPSKKIIYILAFSGIFPPPQKTKM